MCPCTLECEQARVESKIVEINLKLENSMYSMHISPFVVLVPHVCYMHCLNALTLMTMHT